MSVDQAHERFKAIWQALPPDDERPITDNEACTRVHLVDPILESVLGWPRGLWAVEAPGGDSEASSTSGGREGRVDYVVYDRNDVCWFVIEAKKRSTPVVQPMGTVRGLEQLKLTGPVLTGTCWPIVSRQMASYLGRYMPCFGAVTTGEQWVGFLAKLRADNMALEQSEAVVFRSLEDIDHDFELFYEVFSLEGAQRRSLVRRLQPSSGRGMIRAPHARRIVPVGAERLVDYQDTQSFYDDLRQAMDAAFRPIRSDRAALAACFVESRESRNASSRLERVANELGQALKDAVDDYPPTVEAEVHNIATSTPLTLNSEIAPGTGFLARLLGEKSAGKTVFLERFFALQLGKHRDSFVLLWLDVERFSPFDPRQASSKMLETLSFQLFGEDGPTWDHVREVYRREWNQHLRLLGMSHEEAGVEVRQAFVRERQENELRDPHEALVRFAAFATRNRRRLVCLVVDNIDHLQHPEAVIEWVVASHLSMFAMTTVAMEDATLWRLKRAGHDQLANHQPELFWLRRPMVRAVLENRCEYLKNVLSNERERPSKTSTNIGRRGQWRWSVSADALIRAVSAVLLDNDETAQWIGELCNYNLRDVLEVCQQIVLSPHIRAERLLTMQVAQKVSRNRILRTLISPKSHQALGLSTDRVVNIFGFWLMHDFAPMLPARLLAVLREREDDDRNKAEPFAGFVSVFELAERFDLGTSTPRAATTAALRQLATTHLVEPFNPSDIELIDTDARVKITPRGRLHLNWALGEPTYVRLMAEVDPIVSQQAYSRLLNLWRGFLNAATQKNKAETSYCEQQIAQCYIDYLLREMNSCSQLSADVDLSGVRHLEEALRNAWVSK